MIDISDSIIYWSYSYKFVYSHTPFAKVVCFIIFSRSNLPKSNLLDINIKNSQILRGHTQNSKKSVSIFVIDITVVL